MFAYFIYLINESSVSIITKTKELNNLHLLSKKKLLYEDVHGGLVFRIWIYCNLLRCTDYISNLTLYFFNNFIKKITIKILIYFLY
jgi:hypothetical protein